jgi:hypothetical protein
MAVILNNSTGWMRSLFACRALRSALVALVSGFVAVSCATMPEKRKDLGISTVLPFMRMDGSECYYLDDFMPTPDNMVSGKSSGLFLRYYTFRSATYKTWESERVMLAFFSRDNRCWSLFEEYSSARF